MVATTLNPSDANAGVTLSNGNLTVAQNTAAVAWHVARSTTTRLTGKYYVEVTVDNLSGASGTEPLGFGISNLNQTTADGQYMGASADSVGFYVNNRFGYFNNAILYSSFNFMTTGSGVGFIYGLAVDLDSRVIYLQCSSVGNVMNIGLPLVALNAGPYAFGIAISRQNAGATVNFGATPFNMAVPYDFSMWDIETPTLAPTTWSAIGKKHLVATGNRQQTITTIGGGGASGVTTRAQATTNRNSGKWYCEFFIDQIIIAATNRSGIGLSSPQDNFAGGIGGTWGIANYDTGIVFQNNATERTILSYTTSDNIGMAADLDNKKVWFRKNGGNWHNDVIGNQNPATNTGGTDISSWFTSGHFVGPAISMNPGTSNSGTTTCNFGRTAFTYTMPSGFERWSPLDPLPSQIIYPPPRTKALARASFY